MSAESQKPKKPLKERFSRSMKLDETACRICSAIIEEQREKAEDPSQILGPEHGCIDHMHYHARTLEESADECYKASLELIFSHVSDIHMIILKILSEKYGHSVEDMLGTVMKHKEWKNIYLHPVLKSLMYFDPLNKEEEPHLGEAKISVRPPAVLEEEPLSALKKVGVGQKNEIIVPVSAPAPAPTPAPVPAPATIKRRVPKVQKPEPVSEPAPAPAPAPAPVAPTIKRRGPKPKNPTA